MKKSPLDKALPIDLAARLAMIAVCLAAAGVMAWAYWLTILVAVSVFLRWWGRRPPSDTHGSARWAERSELQGSGMLSGRGLILARPLPQRPPLWQSVKDLFRAPLGRSRFVWRQMLAALLGARWEPPPPLIELRRLGHLMAVSPTGGGKGVSLVIPTLLTWRSGSVVVLDPKGENYTLTAQARRDMGNTVHRLDPFGVCGSGGSRFNPMDLIDVRSPSAIDDCLALAQALVVRGQETDSTWNDNAEVCLQAFILFVACQAKPGERNLLCVRELLSDQDAYEGSLIAMRRSDDASGGLRRLGGHVSRWVDRELASILSAALRHLAFLDGPLVSDCLSRSDFDPADLVRKRMAVYLVLPPDKLLPLARLMRLWLSGFMRRLAQGELQERNLVLFMLDEVGNLGPMPVLKEALTVLRAYGLRLYFFLQSLGQLESLFPGDKGTQTAKANIETQLYFGIRDRESAEDLSATIGDTTELSGSWATSRSKTSPTLLAVMMGDAKPAAEQVTEGTTVTRTEIARRLLKPEEILQLSERIVIIMTKGCRPIAAGLVRYYEDEEFRGLAQRSEPAVDGPSRAVQTGPPSGPPRTTGAGGPDLHARCPNPECSRRHRIPAALAGRVGKCKVCGKRFRVPGRRSLPGSAAG
jgi:type IV secretion system protein VirD4